jgi:ABC-type uncharacterized transport system permease subunit
MPEVTPGQIAIVCLAAVLFAGGAGLSMLRIWWDRENLRIAGKALLYLGLVCGIGVLVWHSIKRGSWLPLEDNFDALLWLGLLLALFVFYTQVTRPLRGLDWFVMPIVVLLLAAAAVFGRTKPHEYRVSNIWMAVHVLTVFGGALGFAVAGAVGTMYLIVNRRLRAKPATPGPNLGSLERLEHLTLMAVTLGFSLLTIGAITGIMAIFRGGQTPITKIILSASVWVVYAIVLHSPINPSFRGKKAAVLSVVGFVLMVGTLVAVQFMPGKR